MRALPRALRRAPLASLLVVLLIASIPLAISAGAVGIPPEQIVASFWARLSGHPSPLPITSDAILWDLRLPRVLTAILVGTGLALCGAVLQALTRNPLADPYLLGLSSGASFGAATVIIVGAAIALPLAAFVGAMVALVASWFLAGGHHGAGGTRIVLAGVAVSGFFSALTSLVITWNSSGESYRDVLGWLLGSFAGASWGSATIAVIGIALVGIPLACSGRWLDAFTFGDTTASSLGVDPVRTRVILLLGTALLTGVLVSVSGAIGFIGLLVPHAVRLLTGGQHRVTLWLTGVLGGVALLWADTVARTIFAPRELPVGVITALLGAPLFAALLIRRRKDS